MYKWRWIRKNSNQYRISAISSDGSHDDATLLLDVLEPWGLGLLILQQFVELLELLNGLVFQIRIRNLEADAVCGPRKLSREHLGQDPRHNRHNLNERKWDGMRGCSIALNTGEANTNLKFDLVTSHLLLFIDYHWRNILISQIKYPGTLKFKLMTRHFKMTWTTYVCHKDVAAIEQLKTPFTSQNTTK